MWLGNIGRERDKRTGNKEEKRDYVKKYANLVDLPILIIPGVLCLVDTGSGSTVVTEEGFE